jgi:hypothetical protein
MLGGVFWIVGAVMVALMPEGCVGSECDLPGGSMRDSSPAAPVFLAAALLMGAGLWAVVSRARNAGQFGTVGRIGLVASIAGVAVVVAAGLVQAVFFGGDFPYMPLVVSPAGLGLVTGFLLQGVTILRAGGAAALGGTAPDYRGARAARLQRPERTGLDGHPIRHRLDGRWLRALGRAGMSRQRPSLAASGTTGLIQLGAAT